MLKKPLIVGARGNMGRRYAAILRFIGIEPMEIDKGDKIPHGFDSVLICTPTASHIANIMDFKESGMPILCEKPIATSLQPVLSLVEDLRTVNYPLRMVNQYEYLLRHKDFPGPTLYDYWNHGQDGLPWDCINIAALGAAQVSLRETSPIWTCILNGERLQLQEMDVAYMVMMQSWVQGQHENLAYIEHAHRKAAELAKCKS